MTVVRIPPTLRAEVGGERQVPAQGDTVRAVLEERTLARELAGYRDYAERVRYRLIPMIW